MLTDEVHDQIISMPMLSESLPFQFENGMMIEGLSVACSKCQKDIPPEHTHGELTGNGFCASVKIFALCYNCHLIQPVEARIAGDGTILYKIESGWKKVPTRSTLIEKIKDFLWIH